MRLHFTIIVKSVRLRVEIMTEKLHNTAYLLCCLKITVFWDITPELP